MKSKDWELLEFAEGREAAQVVRRSYGSFVFLLVLLTLLAGTFVWAYHARIEEVARAQGAVVPSGRARTVETLEGGIVKEILVREGDIVKAGQIIAVLDDTGSSASLGELRAQEQALQARAVRLAAELGSDAPDFAAAGIEAESALAIRETALFESRMASYLGQLAVLEAQRLQRSQEIAELAAAMERVAENIALLEEEIEIKTESGIVPRAQILPLEREKSERLQERDGLVSRQDQARAAQTEADARIREIELQRRAEINIERSDTLNQLSVIEESIKSASDIVSRAALRSPVDGVVSVSNVNTIGAVLAPGEEVVRIVPQDDGLQVEARVRPEDIAFLRPDLPAKVKITSFDFTIYGSLPAKVVRVGADAEQDESTGEVFFPVIVETDSNTLTRAGQSFEIKPGMVASVDVLTGERTVLDYILKPFRKAQLEALRER